jgi:hypothetical protein
LRVLWPNFGERLVQKRSSRGGIARHAAASGISRILIGKGISGYLNGHESHS